MSSAMRADEASQIHPREEGQENTSFYSNGLDAIDQSDISNRHRLNDTFPPARDMGRHLESNFHPPADHLLSEAMKKQH